MTELRSISAIDATALELLEAAGISSIASLAKADAGALAGELSRANRMLKIGKSVPTEASLFGWISEARAVVASRECEDEVEMENPPAKEPGADEWLANALLAIPIRQSEWAEKGIELSEIPEGILLDEISHDLEIRVNEAATQVPVVHEMGAVAAERFEKRALGIDQSRVRPIEVLAGPAPRTAERAVMDANDERIALLRTPRVETNRGKNPESRRFVRGVLHSHPMSLAMGAAVTLLLAAWLPIAVVSGGLLFLSQEMAEHFAWVPGWLLVFPAGLPVVAIFYFIWGTRGSCRICGQKQFVPRLCLKNKKAHRIPGLGYIIPVALHMLLFSWFRCTYCGTPVRLKK